MVLGLLLVLLSWQQEVAYRIDVSLRPDSALLLGTEELRYVNHSPDTLSFVWFHLYPNAYRRNSVFSREASEVGDFRIHRAPEEDLGWIEVWDLEADGLPCSTRVVDTEMKVWLPRPLPPGDTLTFRMRFRVKVPAFFSRMGHHGDHYEITQWYPKIVVYDSRKPVGSPLGLPESEYRGSSGWWHPDGYHYQGEFYGEYGTFEVRITLPDSFIVGATGEQVEEVDHPDTFKTLVFRADRVHDFAWVASPDFVVWDTAYRDIRVRILVKDKESHKRFWKYIPEEVPGILAQFERWFGPYPYSTLTVVDGDLEAGGGMEYPNLVIISIRPMRGPMEKLGQLLLLDVVAHEIGHQWFYGIFGNNEMDEAWLDEGFTTFAEMRYMRWRAKQDDRYRSAFTEILGDRPLELFEDLGLYLTLNSPWDEPILGKKAYEMHAYGTVVYAKGSKLLWMLLETLGEARFDSVMHAYYRCCAFRHVTTEDFLRVVREVGGLDPEPMFSPWLYTTQKADLAFRKAEMRRRERGWEAVVEVTHRGAIRPPAQVAAILADGDTVWGTLPPGGDRVSFSLPDQPRGYVLDPHNAVPESDEWNNTPGKSLRIGFLPPRFTLGAYWGSFAPVITWNGPAGWIPGLVFLGTQAALRHTVLFYAGYGLKSHKPEGSLTLIEPFLRRLYTLSLSFGLWQGGDDQRVSLSRTFLSRPGSPTVQRLRIGFLRENVRDILFFNPEAFETGVNSHLYLEYGLTKRQPFWSLALRGRGFWGFGAFPYRKAQVQLAFQLQKPFRLQIEGFAGALSGDAPLQERFFLQGEVREPSPYSLLIPSTGSFAVTGRHLAVGPGMAGYAGQGLVGDAKWVLSLAFPLKGLELYGAVGNVYPSLQEVSLQDLRREVGVRLGGDWGRVILPLWTDRGWAFRFVLWVPGK